MSNIKLIKKAGLVAAISMLPLSQAVMAEASWGLSGWVNEGVTFYDDGQNSDAVQLTDNGNTLGTRMTFAGSADLANTGLNAGFEIILEPRSGVLGFGTSGRGVTGENDNGDAIGVLGNSINVSGAFGKITVGLQSMPTDNIAVLADPSLTLWSTISPLFRGNGITIQGTPANAGDVWGDYLNCNTNTALRGNLGIGIDCNGTYLRGVRYDLPAFGPVSVAVGIANDDVFDIAAKYNGQLGRLNAQLNVGYAQNSGAVVAGAFTGGADNFQLQAGLHDPVTGLFGTVAYQTEEVDGLVAGSGISDDTDAYWFKAGIKKSWLSVGDTAISAQYGSYNDQYGLAQATAGVTGSELERIGFSIDQYFGSKLILYGVYEQLDLDTDGAASSVQELDMFTTGLTFFF